MSANAAFESSHPVLEKNEGVAWEMAFRKLKGKQTLKKKS